MSTTISQEIKVALRMFDATHTHAIDNWLMINTEILDYLAKKKNIYLDC